VIEAVRAAARERDERGALRDLPAVEHDVRDRQGRELARDVGADELAERECARREGGHHGSTRDVAWEITVSDVSTRLSGATASARSASRATFANTGAAISPP